MCTARKEGKFHGRNRSELTVQPKYSEVPIYTVRYATNTIWEGGAHGPYTSWYGSHKSGACTATQGSWQNGNVSRWYVFRCVLLETVTITLRGSGRWMFHSSSETSDNGVSHSNVCGGPTDKCRPSLVAEINGDSVGHCGYPPNFQQRCPGRGGPFPLSSR